MNTPLVTIKLSEYNELLNQFNVLVEKLDGKYAYIYNISYYGGIYPHILATFDNEESTVKYLNEQLEKLNKENASLFMQVVQLQKTENRNWFQKLFNLK